MATSQEYLLRLFEYSHKTNLQFIRFIKENRSELPLKVIQLFDHTLNAHHIWNHRILKDDMTVGVWQENNLDLWEEIEQLNHELSLQIIAQSDLEEILNYHSSSGDAYSAKIGDILLHLANHATHHRAQISLLARQNDIAPIASDYIYHKVKE